MVDTGDGESGPVSGPGEISAGDTPTSLTMLYISVTDSVIRSLESPVLSLPLTSHLSPTTPDMIHIASLLLLVARATVAFRYNGGSPGL